MAESLKQRSAGAVPSEGTDELFIVLRAVQADIEQLRALLATHIHSGVTVGAGNTGAPTTTIASTALNLQP